MEDAHISKPDISSELSEAGVDTALKNEQVGLFAVFDGHGGKEVARFCEDFFVPELIKSKAFAEGNFSVALAETFHRMDEMLELPVRRHFIVHIGVLIHVVLSFVCTHHRNTRSASSLIATFPTPRTLCDRVRVPVRRAEAEEPQSEGLALC
jgi:hypothetical protein